MSQMTFSDYEYSLRKRKTKWEEFLDIMNEIIPWEEWVEFVRPYYPNGKRGRPTKGIEKMLRMYLLQIWFNLSDEGVEDAIYDSYAFRKFMNIDFMEKQAPDATTLLKFRHLLEEKHLGGVFFKAINRVMEATGHIMHGGTIVDATIISAPSSTKNAEKKRDPEMYQTKKEMCCIGKCYATLYSLSTTIFLRHCLPLISENMHFRMTLQEKTCTSG